MHNLYIKYMNSYKDGENPHLFLHFFDKLKNLWYNNQYALIEASFKKWRTLGPPEKIGGNYNEQKQRMGKS